eukprot:CAMPEP_0168330274 /NCGR_PEP_ID=MMETSP0213-20121227/7624_1 /TAXON_ID=151035 /ORGANISM="Euplotes harpa, Strain FSP1.4" /LENGTH=117 /DNA_ID=CAMNT_0008333795 /DNA_START=11 /DNA_END=364 /DNA_ORIENTATION=+
MAWVDYEMWPTLRTDKWRYKANIYRDRVYRAIGGLPTCLLSAAVGAGMAKNYYQFWLIPSYGLPPYALMAITGVVGIFVGKYLGVLIFGDLKEYINLKRNSSLYKQELKNYRNSFYF